MVTGRYRTRITYKSKWSIAVTKKIGVVLNLSARTASKLDPNEVKKTINKQLPSAKLYIVKNSFATTVNKAIKDGCKVLCAGGGDGTVSGVAAACAKHNLVLGVIPFGTMNNFSKDLGLSQDIAKACKVIAKGKEQRIDYATVNGELFLNNSSVGAYAKYVREREKNQSLYGKIPAYLTSLVSFVSRFKILHVTLSYDNKTEPISTPVVFVSNNDYSINQRPFIRRPTLSGGELSVHIIVKSKKYAILKTLNYFYTRKKSGIRYKSFHAKKITIDSKKQKTTIAKDGEVLTAKYPLVYEIHSKQLKVIVP